MDAMDLPQRILNRIAVQPDGCWQWTGAIQSRGYGAARGLDQRMWKAHRLVWTLLRGPIPDDLVIDHLCLNKPCVNPDHMELVTTAENTRRALGVRGAPVNQCLRGHVYDDANTYWHRGRRYCRACMKVRDERYRQERRVSS
jgi:hypothetical protein